MSANKLVSPKLATNTPVNNTIKHRISFINTSIKNNTESSQQKKTIKKTIIPKSANTSKSRIDNFKNQFESLFITHDIIEGYSVSDEMIQPYLDANNLNTENQVWLNIFKNYRHLLYLDQFITFNYYFLITPTVELEEFVKNEYYKLSIATKISINDLTYDIIALKYSNDIYNELNKLINYHKIGKNTDKINKTAVLYAHGELNTHSGFFTVPENVIIAFITPFNKYLRNNKRIVNEIFNITNQEIDNNSDFFKNPCCSLRYDNCLNNTVYYYPGNIIPNYIFETRNIESTGFFVDNDTNLIENVFNTESYFNYTSSIGELINEKHDQIENKIIYVASCRKSDIVLSHLATEFLYRYEHIVSFINMSNCYSFNNTGIDTQCKTASSIFQKYDTTRPIKTANNYIKYLFYDSALSYTFKENYIKKDMYLGSSDTKWKITLDILSKLSKSSTKYLLEYLTQIYYYLLAMMNNNPELFSGRLYELFRFIKLNNKTDGVLLFINQLTLQRLRIDINRVNIIPNEKEKIIKIIKSLKTKI